VVKRSGFFLVVTLVVIATLAGCGGGSKDDAAADDESIFGPSSTTEASVAETTTTVATAVALDPCELVSKAEAEAVVGTTLDEPTPGNEACTYIAPPTGPTGQFEVFVGDGAKKFLDIDRQLEHVFEPIAGAGDESYLEEGTAFVRVGTQWVALRVVRLDDFAVYKQPLSDLAKTVAGRM
jgi:hypothetical protein